MKHRLFGNETLATALREARATEKATPGRRQFSKVPLQSPIVNLAATERSQAAALCDGLTWARSWEEEP